MIATTEKITIGAASSQLWMNLRAVGDSEPIVNRSKIRGIIQGVTNLDPVEAIRLMREHMHVEPERYDKLFRIMPILSWVKTGIEAIEERARSEMGMIKKGEIYYQVIDSDDEQPVEGALNE